MNLFRVEGLYSFQDLTLAQRTQPQLVLVLVLTILFTFIFLTTPPKHRPLHVNLSPMPKRILLMKICSVPSAVNH